MMRLDTARGRLLQAVRNRVDAAAVRLNEARAGRRAHHPARVLERRMEHLARLRLRLERAGKDTVTRREERVARLRGMLRTLGPESAFQRGFSITLGEDGRAIHSAASLKPGDLLRTRFSDGEVTSRVLE
jgi:exodeoxyribonuclease VII large subunit